jgi:hypothetical protein
VLVRHPLYPCTLHLLESPERYRWHPFVVLPDRRDSVVSSESRPRIRLRTLDTGHQTELRAWVGPARKDRDAHRERLLPWSEKPLAVAGRHEHEGRGSFPALGKELSASTQAAAARAPSNGTGET